MLTQASWPTMRPSFGRFRSEKLAASVIDFVHPPEDKKKAPAAGGAGGAGGGMDMGMGMGGAGRVSLPQFQRWVAERAPLLHLCLSTFMHTRCFLYGAAKERGVAGNSYWGFKGSGELGGRRRGG